ncbi:radical SAM protein [Coxiella-like endosymbiont]|uniref:radical SAM protein n=1 Tax=Coxiella-like endosymbiont TaxID=1592897 RepID=UPI00272BCF46|nr:radical SAM protein [Coxiella-like endosymbiont]
MIQFYDVSYTAQFVCHMPCGVSENALIVILILTLYITLFRKKITFRLWLNDLKQRLSFITDYPIIYTIFIGGGTPSLFSASAYEKLFYEMKKVLTLNEEIEITLETNPGSVEQYRFNGYRKTGINRLSLGIQSF